MIRKRNRRAARAAFAISLGVALVLGGAAAAPAAPERAEATPIIVGAKNFTEQYVLGQLYTQALRAKGFKVQYKENIGSTEIAAKALTSGQITAYPEYTGVMLSVTFGRKTTPRSALETYNLAKSLWSRRGYALGRQTPFQDRDAIAVLRTTATRYGLTTIGDLRKVPDLTLAAFPEFQTRHIADAKGPVGMARAYGIRNVDFKPLAGISPYALLDRGEVLAAGIFTTDPPLGSRKYVVLRDPRNVFGFQHVAPIVSKKLVAENPRLLPTLNAVSRLLTLKAMIAMNKAVAIDKKTPAAVAAAFLKANGLA
ncbi:MAG TPA: ABC transporter substrate-binding protein [Gaiellaceae bacterium]|nr:ABC transporter substrate-binding protein [Gaiellaceae bacterium]